MSFWEYFDSQRPDRRRPARKGRTMSIVERMCAAWRAASNGDYTAWDEIPEDHRVKGMEREQQRAALRSVKPEDISDEMLEAAHLIFMRAEDPESNETLRRALAAAIAKGGA